MVTTDTATTGKLLLLNALYIPLAPTLAWLQVPAEQVAILAILLIIDFTTGIIKVFVLKGHLRSYRAAAGLMAKISILLLILALALMGKGLGIDFKLYLSLFASALIISETYSIFGNVYSAISREEVAEFDAVAMVVKRFRLAFERALIQNREDNEK